jgi:hypothetical protein
MRLRYENFAARPHAAFRAALKLLDEPIVTDPFVSKSRVNLGVSHTMAGNTSRFARGQVDVVKDNEWTANMSTYRKTLVTLLTWPLLERYNYPIFDSQIS